MTNILFSTKSFQLQKTIGFLHRIYNSFLKNKRQYKASTKTKSEIRGGGRKPWRQKGTGNARAGSIRSPLWVGGGVIFGPKPRTPFSKINKKEKHLALLSALYLKKNNLLIVNQNIFDTFSSHKTSNLVKLLSSLNLSVKEKILFILPAENKNLVFAAQNLSNIEIVLLTTLNLEQVLKNKYLIFSNISLEKFKFLYN